MITPERDLIPVGKGDAAENMSAARAFIFGHDDNIGVTVTFTGVALLDITITDHSI